jgi:hypothetical protein
MDRASNKMFAEDKCSSVRVCEMGKNRMDWILGVRTILVRERARNAVQGEQGVRG